ncbi:MAG: plasminogen-binding N-terminal domain-containing protein [Campylobacterota bacterium]|nr:plasminogen-binding N-terminal domain-containing protein [Campylobacterota bacterium]
MKLIFLFLFFLSSLLAETTLCYKKEIKLSSIDNTLILDGDKCQGKFSITDMIKQGWKLSDSKIMENNENYNHIYIFNKKSKSIEQIASTKATKTIKKLDLKTKKFTISDISNNNAKIEIGDLKIGQSGIIIHTTSQLDSIIIATAEVIETNNNYSTIKITKKSLINQDAIPTSKYKASNGDTFILNHLYRSSLLIVPNNKAKKIVSLNYPKQKFLNEDFFAAHLKLINKPVPTKTELMNFAQKEQIGTIFIVVKNTLYVVDTISFKTIDKITFNINDNSVQVPFFTKIQKIEKGLLDFGASGIEDYNQHYTALVNNTTYKSENGTLFDSIKDILPW